MKKQLLTGLLVMTTLFAISVAGCGTGDSADGENNAASTGEAEISASDSDDEQEENTVKSTVGTFSTKDIYGEAVTQDIFADYDLTLVNLFATWCGPCVAEMPELAQIQKDMNEKGVNVVAVVLDAGIGDKIDEDAVATAQELAEMSEAEFTFMIPDETYMNGRLANVNAVPESFFVDKEGNIVGETYVGARDYDAWMGIIEAELANIQEAE